MPHYEAIVVPHQWRAFHKGTIYPLPKGETPESVRWRRFRVFEFDAKDDEEAYSFLHEQVPDTADGKDRTLAGKRYLSKCREKLR